MNKSEARSEIRWVLLWALLIVLLSSLPYIWGMFLTPKGYFYTGFTHNIDDGAVYLSWMRQAADGHFFIRNLFTSEPQAAKQFNLFFLLMGNFARFTGLSLSVTYHVFRVVLGVALIFMIWQFSKLFLQDRRQRLILIPVIGLTSGVGWLIPGVKAPIGSVDLWQPEAITFLSIYLNPLFIIGQILMLGSLYFLILMERTHRLKYAVCAGLSIFLLANIHSYDVLTVACVWVVYILGIWIARKKFPAEVVMLSLIAAGITLPSIAYQFYVYHVDSIFRARANTAILSPSPRSYFEGFGLVLVAAIIEIELTIANRQREKEKADSKLLIIAWAIIGFIVPYIPIAQQRKLIMGVQIPLAILCAFFLSRLPKRKVFSLVITAFILFGIGSNIKFISNDIKMLFENRTVSIFAPYISASEMSCMKFLANNTSSKDTIFAPPELSLFLPAYADRQVYYGHWSETPDYTDKIHKWIASVDPALPSEVRAGIIKNTGADFYVFAGDSSDSSSGADGILGSPAVFKSGNLSVYKVSKSAMACKSAKLFNFVVENH